MQPQTILRRSHLRQVTGLSLATIDRMIKRGEFPAPLKLSTQAVGWLAESIEAWIASRQTKRLFVASHVIMSPFGAGHFSKQEM